MKKILSVLLSACLLLGLCGFFAVSSFAEEAAPGEGGTTEETAKTLSWNNGNILSVSDKNGDKFGYYKDTEVFKYVYYYCQSGIDGDDRAVGFYDMEKGTPGFLDDNGKANEKDKWYVAGTSGNRNFTASSAAIGSASWWYTPAVCFTAPETGTVEFVYQYSYYQNAQGRAYDFIVSKNDADWYSKSEARILHKTTTKKIGRGDFTEEYDEVTFEVDVQKGDRIYFIMNATQRQGGEMACQWISSAKYVTDDGQLLGRGLAANDTLDLRFLVQLDSPRAVPTANITVKTPFGDKVQKIVGEIYLGEKKDGGKYTVDDRVYAFTVPLAAKQTTDEVVFSMGNITDTYTVQEYCLTVQNLAKTDASYTTAANTCAGILLYGYLAQIHFDYRTDKLPQVNKELLSSVLNGI